MLANIQPRAYAVLAVYVYLTWVFYSTFFVNVDDTGSFGKVYKAWDEQERIYVALKVTE